MEPKWHTSYRGVSPEYFEIKRWYVDQGAIFSQDDVHRGADVCILGRIVRDELFGVGDPVGKVIRVKNLPWKVVATMEPKGLSMSGQDEDDTSSLTRWLRKRSKASLGLTTSCARLFRNTR